MHEVLNKSNCRHKSINYRPLSVPDLIKVMKNLQGGLTAPVYFQRKYSLHKLEKKSI